MNQICGAQLLSRLDVDKDDVSSGEGLFGCSLIACEPLASTLGCSMVATWLGAGFTIGAGVSGAGACCGFSGGTEQRAVESDPWLECTASGDFGAWLFGVGNGTAGAATNCANRAIGDAKPSGSAMDLSRPPR